MSRTDQYTQATREATQEDGRWSNVLRAKFHAFNPNGLVARKRAADERIWELVDAGLANLGSLYSRGSLSGDDRPVIELALQKRVNAIKLGVALQMLEEACESAEQFIAEVEAKVEAEAAPAADLASELADVCELDRKHRGYELVFDDGSARRVKNAAEARQVAAEYREAQAESACDQLARMSDDEIAVALNDVRQCRQVIHSRLVKNELTDEEHAFARDAMEDLWHEIDILEMEQSSRDEAKGFVRRRDIELLAADLIALGLSATRLQQHSVEDIELALCAVQESGNDAELIAELGDTGAAVAYAEAALGW